PRPLRERQELQTEAEQPPRGDRELEPRAVAMLSEMFELALALAHRRDDAPGELLGAVDDELLVGLLELSFGAPPEDDLGAAERKFVALAAHRLREDRERELAAPEDEERVRL